MHPELRRTITTFRRQLEEQEYFDQTEALVGQTISQVERIVESDDFPENEEGVGQSILLSLAMFQHLVKQIDVMGEDLEDLDSRIKGLE